jgi:hypothetical protein
VQGDIEPRGDLQLTDRIWWVREDVRKLGEIWNGEQSRERVRSSQQSVRDPTGNDELREQKKCREQLGRGPDRGAHGKERAHLIGASRVVLERVRADAREKNRKRDRGGQA